jgi:hypothetical protein
MSATSKYISHLHILLHAVCDGKKNLVSYPALKLDDNLLQYAVHLESLCELMKGLEVMSTSIYTVKTELNNYTLYQYCTSTAV